MNYRLYILSISRFEKHTKVEDPLLLATCHTQYILSREKEREGDVGLVTQYSIPIHGIAIC